MIFKYVIGEIHLRQHLEYLERQIIRERDNAYVRLETNQEIATRVREAHATQGLLEADFFQEFRFRVPDFHTPVVTRGGEESQRWTGRKLEKLKYFVST